MLPIGRGWRLALACLVLAALALGLSAFGGATVASQARDLGTTVRQQSETVRDWLKERGNGETAAPKQPGSRRHKAIGPAPGTYVFEP